MQAPHGAQHLRHRVLVCDPVHPEGLKLLRESGFEVIERYGIDSADLKVEAKLFDGIVVRGRTKVSKEALVPPGRLRLVARAGVGLDNIDLEAAREAGVKVISTPEAPVSSVAELTIALILCLLRGIVRADRSMKEGRWIKAGLMGSELKGKEVGVIGVGGRIGSEVARILSQGFRARVFGYDIIDVSAKAKEIGFEVLGSLEDLLRASAIITIHVPYLPSTHHLIDEEKLQLVREGAILINTSRGRVVDGRALLKALKEGRLAGAGLDVYHGEPPTEAWEKELVSLPNVVCTPHIGAQTEEAQRLESILVAQGIISFFGEGAGKASGLNR